MYITARSGHCQAARAVEQGIRQLRPDAEILTIDAFQYLNPFLARMVDRMYLSVIQKRPELWEYLYDNPEVVERSRRFRTMLHRYDSPRLKGLLEDFQPEAIACTQAFPCGLVADYKSENGFGVPLYAVLTDFLPHAYWVHDRVDGYLVPSDQTRGWLTDRGVRSDRIHVTGIPIDPSFSESPDPVAIRRRLQMDASVPAVLLMGGGQGLGPLLEAVDALDDLSQSFQMLAVTGTNETLYHRLITRAPKLQHPIQVFGHVDFIRDLMSVSDLIVTKPGGLTTSEALAEGLPILAVHPIPGQENNNARFLVDQGVACWIQNTEELARLVQELLDHPTRRREIAGRARALGRPRSAVDAARLILES
jgi:processive 1,2-diacylglycerol beta-glucosyltransferase